MLKRFLLCSVLAPLLAACAADAQLPARASGEEIRQLHARHAEQLRNTPRADHVRSYGIYLQQADGSFAAEKGAVLVLPQQDGSYLIGYYLPRDGGFERIGEPVQLAGTRVPHVGNPRGEGTCLRARKLDGSGEWFGCVERGQVVTGVE